MSDIDNVLRGAIRELAQDVRMRADLASTAVTAGRRLRSRRRLRASLLVSVAVASVAVGTPYVVSRPAAPPAVLPEAVPESATLPAAPEVPGAVQQPDLVGSDAGVLHFGADLSAVPDLTRVRWESHSNGEWLTLFRDESVADGATQVSVHVAAPGRPIRDGGEPLASFEMTIEGRPAKLDRLELTGAENKRRGLSVWRLVWEPVDRLRVVVLAGGRNPAVLSTVAHALRLDRAQHCAQPVRATVAPAGTTLGRCSIELDASGVWLSSSFSVDARMPFGPIQVTLGEPPSGYTPDRSVEGKPATWSDESDMLIVYDYLGRASLTVMGESEETVTSFVKGLERTGDLQHLDTWPQRPI